MQASMPPPADGSMPPAAPSKQPFGSMGAQYTYQWWRINNHKSMGWDGGWGRAYWVTQSV